MQRNCKDHQRIDHKFQYSLKRIESKNSPWRRSVRHVMQAVHPWKYFFQVHEPVEPIIIGIIKDNEQHCTYKGIDPSQVDIITGSLSKAIPAQGGFVAGSQKLITYLQHTAATYIFSSALNPPSILASLKALELILNQPHRGIIALEKGCQLRNKLFSAGFSSGLSESAIVPVFLGTQENCLSVTAKLREHSILASPILYPAVPRNKTRLRICTSPHFKEFQMDQLVHTLQSAGGLKKK